MEPRIHFTQQPNLDGLGRRFREGMARANLDVAKYVVRDNIARIDQRIDYKGAAQKTNSETTLKIKAAKRQGDTPLRATGVLADESKWRINGAPPEAAQPRSDLSALASIEPPITRLEALSGLRNLGYVFLGLSAEAKSYWGARIEQAFTEAWRAEAAQQSRANAQRRALQRGR